MKSIVLFLISLLSVLMFTACKGETDVEPPKDTWSYVYTPTEITLPDGWYVDERPELSYRTDTNALSVEVHYELPPIDESGFIPFIYGTAQLAADGTLISIQSDNEDEAPSVNSMTDAVKTDLPVLHDGASVWFAKTFADGTTASVEAMYTDYDAGLWLNLTDESGNVLFSVEPAALLGYDISRDIGTQNGGDIFYVYDLARTTDSAGTPMTCILTSEGLAALDDTGRLLWVSDIRDIRSMIVTGEHGLLLLCSTRGTQSLTMLDANNGHSAGEIALDEAMQTDGDSVTLFSGGDGVLYAQNRRGIWALSVMAQEDGTLVADGTLRMDFTLSEVAVSDVEAVGAVDERTLYLVLRTETTNEDMRSELYRYDYVLPEDVTVKEEIVLARLGTHPYLETVVRDFNKSSETHRIVIRDYTRYEDMDARRMALDTDIVSDDIPDLFLFDSSGVTDIAEVYSSAGVFADLKPMVPNYDDLFTCVRKPYETLLSDGTAAQYLLPLSYVINSYVGHTEDFGDTVYASVTAEDMLAFYRSVPDDRYIMQNCYDLQRYLLYANLDGYYDRLTAECSVANGDLAALMNGSQDIYDSAEYFGENESTVADFHDDFRAGTLRLQRISVSGLPGWVRLQRALGEFIPVGYPNREGKHYANIAVNLLFAASVKTEYTEQITQFLSLWFAHNAGDMYDSTPLLHSDIDAALALYADQTYIENGANSGWLHDSQAAEKPGLHYKLTDEDGASFGAFLDSIDARVQTDTPAADIFWKEFYDRGTRSWEDVMTAAQSRMGIYLSEQMK